jgi:spore maturation protein CgeB
MMPNSKRLRVLLVGVGEFYHLGAFFQKGLRDLGLECVFIDEGTYVRNSIGDKLAYHFFDKKPRKYLAFNRDLVRLAVKFQPDVILATKGAFISPDALLQLKHRTPAVLVNFATDDPFNRKTSGHHIVEGIRFYDVYICTKRAIMADVRRSGCRTVLFLPFGYEPSLHFPEQPLTAEERNRYTSDVAFIGGADADRIPFFEALLDAIPNLNLQLYGGYWDRYPRLRKYHRGFALGRDYRLVMAGTKVAPCLVRRANRDGHVMRSFEIPACGAFMLAERTDEHLELFCESQEMACFSTPEELGEKVRHYLCHENERKHVAHRGHAAVTAGSNSYRDRVGQILQYCTAKFATDCCSALVTA